MVLLVLFVNSGAGCGSKSDDPQPDNIQSLVGKWQIQSSAYNITKQTGTTLQDKVDYKAKGINVVWEFFGDGRLIATQDGKSGEARWKLNVTKLDQVDIEKGTLTMISDQYRQLAAAIGQSGDYTFDIVTVSAPGTPTRMSLSVDMTKIGPYKENILVYALHKL